MHEAAEMFGAAIESATDAPGGLGADTTVRGRAKDRNLAEPARADAVAGDVHEYLHSLSGVKVF